MKRTLLIICTLLCANVLSAQTWFWIDSLQYKVTSTNPAEVEVYSSNQSIVIADIPATVTYEETDYSVTTIRDYVFSNRSSLTSVTIPYSITYIGNYAFAGCSSLTNLNFNAINCNGGFGYDVAPLSTITIGDSVQIISENFAYGRLLTSIDIPNSVTSIGNNAFAYCRYLTSVTLPENATISTNAFSGCGTRNNDTIDNVIYILSYDNDNIGNYTFEDVSNVTFTIGDSVYTPSSAMVYYYTSELSGDVTLLSSITNNGVTYPVTSIDYEAFKSCSSLTSVTIPNSVTSIGYDAFNGCSSLTSIEIPNSITSIEKRTFKDCSSLTSVTLGENVTSIDKNAFNGCSFLQNVTCLATNPPAIVDNTVFPYPNIATLTVPCGTLEAYSTATSFWNMFFADRISERGYNVEVSVNDEAFGSVTVESDCSTGTLTATANEGYRFVIWNDGNTENPRVVSLSSDTAFTAIFALIDETSLLDAEIEEISFFPNPTNSKVTFNQAIERIELMDLAGKTLRTFRNESEINIEQLPAGVYYLRLTNNEKQTLRKLIKE